VQTGLRTLLQRSTLDAERGRVFSLQNLATSVMLMAGATAAGFLGEAVGIMPILALQGVAYLVGGVMVLAGFTRAGAPLDLAVTRP
jgi:MFS family permease